MTTISPLGYAGICAGATLLAAVLVPLALWLALRLEAFDPPAATSSSPRRCPTSGGVAIEA